MWGWKRKPRPAPVITEADVLARWKAVAATPVFEEAVGRGLAEELDTFPYAIARTNADGVADWIAPNYRFAGNVLVCWSTSWPGESLPDPEGVNVYQNMIRVARGLSDWMLPVCDTVYLLGTVERIETIHREVGEALGIMSRSLTVVDLFSGRAIGWDANRGIMTEIEPGMPAPE